jgi:hypothetical protein
MINELLSATDAYTIYAISSLFGFLAIFALVLIWVVRVKKSHVERMSRLPLDDPLTDIIYGEQNNGKI